MQEEASSINGLIIYCGIPSLTTEHANLEDLATNIKAKANPYCPQLLEPDNNWNWTTLVMTNVEQFLAFVKNPLDPHFFEILEIIESYVLIIFLYIYIYI